MTARIPSFTLFIGIVNNYISKAHPSTKNQRWGKVRGVPAVLAATGLEKRYGRVQALAGVDVEVGEGQLVGLLGPNGAGKSTLVKIACGLVRPTSGRVEVCGAPAGSAAAEIGRASGGGDV